MDAVNAIADGVKNATLGESSKQQKQGQKKDKKEKKKGGDAGGDGRPLEVLPPSLGYLFSPEQGLIYPANSLSPNPSSSSTELNSSKSLRRSTMKKLAVRLHSLEI
jgi:hypothetical protein